MEKNEETIGEDLIADFLEDKDILFERYYKIYALEGDDKPFREADFYLPQYGVYIEFLGMWNNPENRYRYKKKMAIYHRNKIPCVYLWPDNLGTLDWMIKRRIREVLLKYNKRINLFRYEFDNYMAENLVKLVMGGLAIYFFKDMLIKVIIGLLMLIFLINTLMKYINRLQKLNKSKWVVDNKAEENKIEDNRKPTN